MNELTSLIFPEYGLKSEDVKVAARTAFPSFPAV
jgi:hypothetical protein